MRFSDIKGNSSIVSALRGMVDTGRIPHAMLFHENDGGGALPIVLAFLQYLYCRSRQEGDSCSECPSCNKWVCETDCWNEEEGRFRDYLIEGDFFGELDAALLAERFEGREASPEGIREALRGVNAGDYINGVTNEEFAALLEDRA